MGTPYLSSSTVTLAETFVGVDSVGVVMLVGGDHDWLYTIALTGDYTTSAALTGTLAAGDSLQVPLTCTPTALGANPGSVAVTLSAPPEPDPPDPAPPVGQVDPRPDAPPAVSSCTLACNARSNAPCWQDASLTSIDFSQVACAGTLDAPALAVSPASGVACTVNSVVVSGTGFSLQGDAPTSIADGGSAALTVRFAPPLGQGMAEKPYTGSLTLAWTCGSESGSLTLSLAGIGLEPQELAEPISSDPDETKQRATIYVPTHDSLISAGYAYTPTGETVTQHGFTARANKNVFFRAALSSTFQAKGQVWFQSGEDALYAMSIDGTTMVGTNGLYLGGGSYLALMAGYGAVGTPADVRNSSGSTPGQPDAVSSIPSAVLAADLVWEITDKVVAAATVAKAIERAIRLNWHKPKFKTQLGVIGAAIQTAATTTGLVTYLVGKANGTPSKNMNFYSQAGILAGTPAFCSIYGFIGVNYRSLNVTLLGNIAVAVSSMLATTLDSLFGTTAVSAGTDLTIECWLSTFMYCTQGPMNVYGKKITLGGVAADGAQLPTATMKLSATQKVLFETSVGGSINIKGTTPLSTIDINATTQAKFTTAAVTSIAVGKWEILGNGRGIEIKGPKGTVLKLSAAGVEIGGAAGQIKVAPALADVGGALKISAGSVTCVGLADVL